MLSSVPANLIRQWCYCPRVVYYQELVELPIQRPAWVAQGERFHQMEARLWQRRNLACFQLEDGKQHHNLPMRSATLGLHGIADMVVETDEAVYAVEFKLAASNKKRGDVLQLAAYAMLAEDHFQKPGTVGFLAGSGKTLHTINIDTEKRQQVATVAQAIRTMLAKGRKPESSASLAQCGACEYVNFCNDRL